MSSVDSERPPYVTIANELTVQLSVIGLGALVLNAPIVFVAASMGLIGLPFVVIVNTLVLWFVVRVVFAALDDLLEAKLDGTERADRSGD